MSQNKTWLKWNIQSEAREWSERDRGKKWNIIQYTFWAFQSKSKLKVYFVVDCSRFALIWQMPLKHIWTIDLTSNRQSFRFICVISPFPIVANSSRFDAISRFNKFFMDFLFASAHHFAHTNTHSHPYTFLFKSSFIVQKDYENLIKNFSTKGHFRIRVLLLFWKVLFEQSLSIVW